jgi:RNA polymerase sigma-70 factor (ECF subfamily)
MTELDRIVRDYSAMVQGALRQLGVEPSQLEDASQEVFLVLARRFAEYDAERSLASWLWGIARGVASTHRRSRRRRTRLVTSFAAQPGAHSTSPDDIVAQGQARDMLRAFLDSLDEDKCAVFVLSEIEGCSGPEIAARLDANLNTVYARLRAARRRFDDVVEQRRRGIAAASAWCGFRWGMPKVATASLSTVLAAAVVVPSIDLAHEPPPVVVASRVTLGEPKVETVTRNVGVPAKVKVERNASPMPKALPTIALAAALTVPAVAQAKPSKAPARTDQDADDAALVSGLETREYIFDGDDVDGDIHGPSGENVTARVNVHHESLIRIRGHFISELITLATDI